MINLIFKNDKYLDSNGQLTEDIEKACIIKSRKIANQVAAEYDAEVTSYYWKPDRENPWLEDMEDE